jgi:hypothetical protein
VGEICNSGRQGPRPEHSRRTKARQLKVLVDEAQSNLIEPPQRPGAITIITQVQGIGPTSADGQSIEVVNTKQIELFIPILKELDFGDRFLLSTLHRCGIGHRSTPVRFWQEFLIQAQSECVGVSGLYREPEMLSNICWLGCCAIRPEFPRHGHWSGNHHRRFRLCPSLQL